MLSHVEGTVKSIYENSAVIDIGTIGLLIHTCPTSSLVLGSSICLYTHLHWNQEQGPSIYGFATSLERDVFVLIIGCSGLGPKIGLNIIAHIGPETFLSAIQEENAKTLSIVNGIGIKKAEQIIMQLKHKVIDFIKNTTTQIKRANKHLYEVKEALNSLHYTQKEISEALRYVTTDENRHNNEQPSFNHLMRQALAFLAKKT